MPAKIILPVLLLFFSVKNFGQLAPASASEIMKEAFPVAKKQNKKVFVIFHASWCGWCHKMDTSLNDPSIKKFFDDNFVIRHLVVFESKTKKNLENPGAEDMVNKYGGNGEGIPYWLIFDKDGNFLADSRRPGKVNGIDKLQNTGCPASKEEVEYFIDVLKKTTLLKEHELDLIKIRFRKNEE
jgi:thioredoxin-related protein